MAKVSLSVKLVAHEGKGDELARVFDDVIAQVEHEPGTEVFVLNRSSVDPDCVYLFEVYRDADALAEHRAGDALKALPDKMASLVKERDFLMGTPLTDIGLGQ